MSRHESNDKIVEEARLLLPWYLTNTLQAEEQALVNEALELSTELRNEFLHEEQMMRLVKENTSLLELTALDTTEQRLDKMLSRIDREVQIQERDSELPSSTSSEASGAKSGSWFGDFFKKPLFNTEWLTPANAVFASLLAVQAGLLGVVLLSDSHDVSYHAASVSELSALDDAKSIRNTFLMEFHSTAEHGEVCDFLNNWNARIISGPDSANIFEVEIKTNSHTDVVALADTVMEQAKKDAAPLVFIGARYQESQEK